MEIKSFKVYIDGKVASCVWQPVTDIFSNNYAYELEYKKTTENTYTKTTTKINELSKVLFGLAAKTAYNFRVRAKLIINVSSRVMAIGSSRTMNIGASRVIAATDSETQYSAYSSVITLTTKASFYILGYGSEIIEIPRVYSQDQEDELSNLQTTVAGNKLRWTNSGFKVKINLKTRPLTYSEYMKIYGFVKSRLNQAETIYIDTLKKEISAYIDIKATRNDSGDKDLYSLDISIEEA